MDEKLGFREGEFRRNSDNILDCGTVYIGWRCCVERQMFHGTEVKMGWSWRRRRGEKFSIVGLGLMRGAIECKKIAAREKVMKEIIDMKAETQRRERQRVKKKE